MLGKGIGANKVLQKLSLNVSNIGATVNMKEFMKGFGENDSVESLDLSVNELTDESGMYILKMVKF
jgi:hypothetical protein